MDIKARQEITLPTAWGAGEMVFVDNGDGTATQHVTSASGVPRRVLGGVLVAGTLTRTGALTNRLNKTATTLAHLITPARNLTLTRVTLERVTLSAGTAALNIWNADGATFASSPVTEQAGGLSAALNITLTAGTAYYIGAQAIGGTLTAQLSSGHTWPGLTVGDDLYTQIQPGTGGIAGEDNGAPAAQLAMQFEAAGQVARAVQGGAGITVTSSSDGTLTLNAESPLPGGQLAGMVLRATGADAGALEWAYPQVTPGRSVSGVTPSLAPEAGGNVTLGNTGVPALIRKLTTDVAADVCLYAAAADRDADYARLQATPDAAPGVPVLAQYRTAAGTLTVAGAGRGVNSSTVYMTVINRSDATQPLTVTLTLEDA